MTTAFERPFAARLRAALLGLAACVLVAGARADAANAVLAKDGTLYEVFVTNYGQIVEGANGTDSSMPVVALRSTPPGKPSTVEIVGGTVTPLLKFSESLEYDDTTQTVFVVYTSLQVQGFFADVRAAMRRDGGWSNGGFLPNAGLYFSVNPKLLVTRQRYKDLDDEGAAVTKTRSILSVVWWEETALSQARYAALFIEDGSMKFDEVAAYNLNELAGAAGPTDSRGLPTSSYMYPAVQRDQVGDGGVLVSFANLATRKQQVLRLGFPDDYTKPPTTGTTTAGRTSNSRTTPIGRGGYDFAMPTMIDLPFTLPVGTLISPAGVPTYFWTKDGGLNYLTGDAASLARGVMTIPLRQDFQLDSALSVVRTMAEKQ
ncbi:MAG TPA: hypothetical protein PLB01_08180 [Thermoanaerobaculia bacterium]|nr:hypothetical protein [Thermoanaerobaculia bacterium]